MQETHACVLCLFCRLGTSLKNAGNGDGERYGHLNLQNVQNDVTHVILMQSTAFPTKEMEEEHLHDILMDKPFQDN